MKKGIRNLGNIVNENKGEFKKPLYLKIFRQLSFNGLLLLNNFRKILFLVVFHEMFLNHILDGQPGQ